MDPKVVTALAGEIARTIQAEGNVRTIFGEPVMLDSRKVIPVSTVVITMKGGGGGSGSPPQPEEHGLVSRVKRLIPVGVGGGVALDVRVIPVGYLHETDDGVQYCPIALPPEVLARRKK